jgi:hypothetical protein
MRTFSVDTPGLAPAGKAKRTSIPRRRDIQRASASEGEGSDGFADGGGAEP